MRDGWVETTLGEVVTVVNGGTPSTKNESYWGGSIIWITTTELTAFDGKSVNDSKRTITEAGLNSGPARMVQSGTTLVGTTATIGTCAIAACNLTFNQQISGLVAKNKDLNDQYLFYWIQFIKPILEGLSAGTSFKRISTSVLKSVAINLPPLPEQKRIVDLISSIDSYIEALQQQLESAKRSRNAVLHELLTAGGADWVETTLGKASDVIMGRQLSPSKKLGTRPRPYIRAANIGSWGINVEDIYEMDFTEIEEERFACKVGDTILVEGGNEKSVGCPAFITDKEAGLCIQNTVIRCRSTNSKLLDPYFQYHLLRFMFWRGDFAQLCAGTTIMHLGQKRAEVVPISIPPLGKQLDIVDTISKFDLTVTNLEETLENAKSLRSGLLSDLLSGTHQIPASYDKVMGAA